MMDRVEIGRPFQNGIPKHGEAPMQTETKPEGPYQSQHQNLNFNTIQCEAKAAQTNLPIMGVHTLTEKKTEPGRE